jgi:hypothetical protein
VKSTLKNTSIGINVTTKHTISKIENFLTEEEYLHINALVGDGNFPWTLQTSKTGGDTERHGFLQSIVNLEYPLYIQISDKIVKSFNLQDYTLGRAYYNGQWFSRDGSFHCDDGSKTVLIYLTPWDPEWGGFTHFMPNNEHIIIPPVTNSAVCFDANIPHKAYSFSLQHAPMRITLAFKYYD